MPKDPWTSPSQPMTLKFLDKSFATLSCPEMPCCSFARVLERVERCALFCGRARNRGDDEGFVKDSQVRA